MIYHVHINRTGGTSVAEALGMPHAGERHETVVVVKRNTAMWAQMQTFAFVRNPFDRLLSIYLNRCRTLKSYDGLSFPEFIEKACKGTADGRTIMTAPCANWLSVRVGGQFGVGVGFVGRFEALDVEYARLCDWLGIQAPPLPHRGATDHGSYHGYYTVRMQRMVERIFRRDLEWFGYTFNGK